MSKAKDYLKHAQKVAIEQGQEYMATGRVVPERRPGDPPPNPESSPKSDPTAEDYAVLAVKFLHMTLPTMVDALARSAGVDPKKLYRYVMTMATCDWIAMAENAGITSDSLVEMNRVTIDSRKEELTKAKESR